MSGILVSAISEFLDRLPNERHFDAPFLALLHLQGFRDVQFIHGPYEFGKDFVAKVDIDGVTHQCYFQSKHGDLRKPIWEGEVRNQCETMAFSQHGHPAIDSSLPSRAFVVITGRLKGQVPVLIEDYQTSRVNRGLPEIEVWTREDLVGMLAASTCLGESFDWTSLGHLLWESGHGPNTPFIVERYTRRWAGDSTEDGFWRAVLEYGLLRDRLLEMGLGFHAHFSFLGIIRSFLCSEFAGTLEEESVLVADRVLAEEMRFHVKKCLAGFDDCTDEELEERILEENDAGAISAGSRLFLSCEILALWILYSSESDPEYSKCSDVLKRIIRFGCVSRPISENYGAGVLPIAIALSKIGDEPGTWLKKIVEWVEESYQDNIGLAPIGSNAETEVWYTMGHMFDHPGILQMRTSTVVSAIMDSLCILELREDYQVVHPRLLSTRVVPKKLAPINSEGQFQSERGAAHLVLGGEYPPEFPEPPDWSGCDHYGLTMFETRLDQSGRPWLGCAAGLLLRDRWWLGSLRLASRRPDEGPGTT